MKISELLTVVLLSPLCWCVAAFFVCQIKRFHIKRKPWLGAHLRWAKASRIFLSLIIVIAIAQHRVMLYSGPISGRVTDAEGLPVVDARVVLSCNHINAPIALPWFAAIFNQSKEEQASIRFSDKDGNYQLPWIGFQVWKSGCNVYTLSVTKNPMFDPEVLSMYSNGTFQGQPAQIFARRDFQLRGKKESP